MQSQPKHNFNNFIRYKGFSKRSGSKFLWSRAENISSTLCEISFHHLLSDDYQNYYLSFQEKKMKDMPSSRPPTSLTDYGKTHLNSILPEKTVQFRSVHSGSTIICYSFLAQISRKGTQVQTYHKSKAFDKIRHSAHLNKLPLYGLTAQLCFLNHELPN